jgi:hypothetical protein
MQLSFSTGQGPEATTILEKFKQIKGVVDKEVKGRKFILG